MENTADNVKKRVFVDMDNVLVDFRSGFAQVRTVLSDEAHAWRYRSRA